MRQRFVCCFWCCHGNRYLLKGIIISMCLIITKTQGGGYVEGGQDLYRSVFVRQCSWWFCCCAVPSLSKKSDGWRSLLLAIIKGFARCVSVKGRTNLRLREKSGPKAPLVPLISDILRWNCFLLWSTCVLSLKSLYGVSLFFGFIVSWSVGGGGGWWFILPLGLGWATYIGLSSISGLPLSYRFRAWEVAFSWSGPHFWGYRSFFLWFIWGFFSVLFLELFDKEKKGWSWVFFSVVGVYPGGFRSLYECFSRT